MTTEQCLVIPQIGEQRWVSHHHTWIVGARHAGATAPQRARSSGWKLAATCVCGSRQRCEQAHCEARRKQCVCALRITRHGLISCV
jgi:hypothetical protein